MFHIVLLLVLQYVAADVCEDGGARTCDDCVLIHASCVWISEPPPNDTRRCIDEKNKLPWMTKVKYGGKNTVHIDQDEDFRLPLDDQPAVQIRPQKLRLRLRRGEPVHFMLRYKALSNYPLDIYYLVDQTNTMRAHVTELKNMSFTLAGDLAKLTKNYKIAFGYYSDKLLMPYNAMVPKLLANPCALNENEQCAPGTNFVHALNFTDDVASFFKQVEELLDHFTANLDNLEGGLDALLQILECDSFGWRTHSRKMVMIATDGLLHSAGDGILGGAVRRAPGKCAMGRHADGRLIYDNLLNDYPSVEEIYRRLMAKKVTVLLAIEQKEDNVEYFTSLNNLLHEVSYLAMLQPNTNSNISGVLEAGFLDSVKKVHFQVIDKPNYLQFEPATICDGHHVNHSWACWDVMLDNEYIFNVTVTLTEVPPRKIEVIRIEEKHLHEFLEIEVEYAEKCDCSDSRDGPAIVPNGKYACGVYVCNPGWVGDRCDKQCDPSKHRYFTDSAITCSGNGGFNMDTCRCVCDKQFAGEFCQTKCGVGDKGVVCSGNGVCTEKGCACFQDFVGDNCNCTQITDSCVKNGSTAVCENHGSCECGKCKCTSRHAAITYTGHFCDRCSGCQECLYNDILLKHVMNQLGAEEQRNFTFNQTSNTTDLQCSNFYSPNSTYECTVHYKHEANETTVISYSEVCTLIGPMSYAQIGHRFMMIIVPIVLFGVIALLSWKLTVTIKDSRDFAKFEKQTKKTIFSLNDLYDDPVKTYLNPGHKID